MQLCIPLFLWTLSLASVTLCMDHHDDHYSIILPGQNGMGGDSLKEHFVTGAHQDYNVPISHIDLGQDNCIRHFQDQLARDSRAHEKKLLLYGVSQGTATLINWASQMPVETQDRYIKCLILEAVLGTPQSAIMHTTEKAISSKATYLPFSRSWIPIAAKCIFPSYSPWGKKALESATKLSPNLPVIIMHNIHDPQLSINDARELYCTLRNLGNQHVYLFEVNDRFRSHFDILENDRDHHEKIAAIYAIYKKYNLPSANKTLSDSELNKVDLANFQPSIADVKAKIQANSFLPNFKRDSIDWSSSVALLTGACYMLKNTFF